MQIAILGTLEARGEDGSPIALSGARLRDLVACLALAAGRPVSTAALVDAVWGEHPPAEAANALQTLVSRARRALGAASAIEQSAAGYRLHITAGDVDAFRFEQLLSEGRSAEALALWRGPALLDVGEFAASDVRRLNERWLDAKVDCLDVAIDDGRAAEHVAEIESLLAAHPTHEKLTGLLMRALTAAGRQAEALTVYETLRAHLADELGVDPGSDLQAVHLEVLRGEIDPAPARPRRRTNVRAQLTSFVGRSEELARIGKLLDEYRLVTLVGPGGAGKTRLAAEATAALVDSTTDGVWIAELASVTDPADVPLTVLGSVGLREAQLLIDGTQRISSRDAMSRLLDGLADASAVLVLDNCEHLIDACASLADTLLGQCPQLRIVATSREPLGIVGESILAVPPLSQPTPSTPPESALEFAAVRLFSDRAAAVSAGFVLTESATPLVVEIVRRLDGLPLAIELAAARLRSMPLAEIAERLSDRFRLLTGGSRTALPRHRTLRAVVEWSWELLSPQERLLTERFAVFPAGATPEAVRAVCAEGNSDVDDLLASLVDKSLLQRLSGGTRLRMLETIREYGLEQLSDRGELRALRERHAEYFSELMRTAEPQLTTREQLAWLAVVEAERDNILAALRFWCDIEEADEALSLAVSVSSMAMLLGNHADVAMWLAEAVDVPGEASRDLRTWAQVLYVMNTAFGALAVAEDDLERQLAELRELGERLDDIDIERWPMAGLLRPAYAMLLDDPELGERYVAEALTVANPWLRAAVRMLRANMSENDGDVERMRADVDIAVAEFRILGERWGLAGSLRALGTLRTMEGDLAGAANAYGEALTLMEELGSREDEVHLRLRLADLALRDGDTESARRQYATALDTAELQGAPMEMAITLCSIGMLELRLGDLDQAHARFEDAASRSSSTPGVHPGLAHMDAFIYSLGLVLAAQSGDVDLALARAERAYAAAVRSKDMPIVAGYGLAVAQLVYLLDDAVLASELLGASAALRGGADPTEPAIAALTEQLVSVLGEPAYANAFAAGRELDRAKALARLDPARLDPVRLDRVNR